MNTEPGVCLCLLISGAPYNKSEYEKCAALLGEEAKSLFENKYLGLYSQHLNSLVTYKWVL